jgi:hypothetical protein
LDKGKQEKEVSTATKDQLCLYCDYIKGGVLALAALGMPFLIIAAMFM